MLIGVEQAYVDGKLVSGMAIETTADGLTTLRRLGDATPDAQAYLVMPECTDLQVNGGGGVMFNDQPAPDGLRAIRDAHRALGTGEIMPTVITDTPDVMDAAVDAVLSCADEPGIVGIHIEGPHINPLRRGTHATAHIRPLDSHTIACLERLRARRIPTILTVAPETCDPDLLNAARNLGVTLSAGHSAATKDQMHRALEAGVSMFTHLFNGMPQMTSRDPGIVGTAILSDAFCGVIVDGHHVDWDMLRIAFGARPEKGRMFAVSDAMSTVGGPDRFTLYGREIKVEGGKLINSEGSLAGAHIDLLTSLRNLHTHVGLPLQDAIAACTDIPRNALGLTTNRIGTARHLDDMVLLDRALALDRRFS